MEAVHVRLEDADDMDGNSTASNNVLGLTSPQTPAASVGALEVTTAASTGSRGARGRWGSLACCGTMSAELASVVLVGVAFLVIFSAFNTAQDYATTLLGRSLGNIALSVLYAAFIASLFVSPRITQRLGHKASLIGGGACYGIFMTAQLTYFGTGGSSGHFAMLVVFAAGVNGFGASLLWTAQGNLLAAASNEENRGSRAGLFWALFMGCFVVGNVGTSLFFQGAEGDGSSTADSTSADEALFFAFVVVVIVGIGFFVVLPKLPSAAAATEVTEGSVAVAVKATWAVSVNEPILRCWPWFFLSGIINTYQQGAMPRLFAKADNGLAFSVFGIAEVTAAFICGRVLDVVSWKRYFHGTSALLLVSLIAALVSELSIGTETRLSLGDERAILPLTSLALGGAGDSAVNVLLYALVGSYYPSGVKNARGIAAYKAVQSLGFAVGFAFGGIAGVVDLNPVAAGLSLIFVNGALVVVGLVWPPDVTVRAS